MVSLKASAQFEWKIFFETSRFQVTTTTKGEIKVTTLFFGTQRLQEPNVVYSQENGTFHLLLHAHK
jgi:hypothetical protein